MTRLQNIAVLVSVALALALGMMATELFAAQNMMHVVNGKRAAVGLYPLAECPRLQAAAQWKADMWAAGQLRLKKNRLTGQHDLYRGAWPGSHEGVGWESGRSTNHFTGCNVATGLRTSRGKYPFGRGTIAGAAMAIGPDGTRYYVFITK